MLVLLARGDQWNAWQSLLKQVGSILNDPRTEKNPKAPPNCQYVEVDDRQGFQHPVPKGCTAGIHAGCGFHWQEELINYLNAPVHPRQVLWYVDEAGNQGKSWMASYLSSTTNAFVVTNGKIADIAHAYNNETTVIFDLSGTQVDKIDHIYALMEAFKKGNIFSPKYESVVKTFSPCHVVAFANFIPDHSKLSQDRWLVKTL
jgi:hypothetical protein